MVELIQSQKKESAPDSVSATAAAPGQAGRVQALEEALARRAKEVEQYKEKYESSNNHKAQVEQELQQYKEKCASSHNDNAELEEYKQYKSKYQALLCRTNR